MLEEFLVTYGLLSKMIPRLRADVEKAKKALKEFEGIRYVLGGTTDAERAQLKAELAEAEKRLKDELDNPTPREAPERGRARRSAGQERRLDAQFLPRESDFEDGRTAQVIDVLTRAYQSRRRNISQPQLYREAQAL